MSYKGYDPAPICMMKKFFQTLVLLLLALFGIYFFTFSSNEAESLKRPLNAFIQKNFQQAEQTLDMRYHLYRGYVKQAQGNFHEADFLFNLEKEKCEEALLAKKLNAVLLCDLKCLSEPLPSKHQLFFDGLYHYFSGSYAQATKELREYVLHRKNFEKNLWFDYAIEHHFPEELIERIQLRSEFFCGQHDTIREWLKDKEENESVFYLLALSFLSENPKLSLFYLSKVDPTLLTPLEKIQCEKPLEAAAKTLLEQKNPLFFSFVEMLEKWKKNQTVEELAQFFTRRLTAESLSSFSEEKTPYFASCVKRNIEGQFVTLLKQSQPKDLFPLYTAFVAKYPEIKSNFSVFLEEEISQAISRDDELLENTTFYIDLWKKIHDLNHGIKKGNHLANRLQQYGKLCWLKENEEKKGTQLLLLGMELKSKRERLLAEQEIEGFFRTLYERAEGSNLVSRLSLIYDALQELQIEAKSLYPKGSTANYLADAEYLFSVRNYLSAKTHAELVLKVEPENESARLLFGLACYHTGDYKKAIMSLQQLDKRDATAEKVLMLCLASNHQSEKELVQVDCLDSIEEE